MQKLMLKIVFHVAALSLMACVEDAASPSKVDDNAMVSLGACTDSIAGEIRIDSTTEKSYYCENGKWLDASNYVQYLDTIVDGKYTCTDSAGYAARFDFEQGHLAYRYSTQYSTGASSSIPYSYKPKGTPFKDLVYPRDYSTYISTSTEKFAFNHITNVTFEFIYYDSFFKTKSVYLCKASE